jgi:TolB-like protein/Tfp pilus assembly protein PilF
MTTNYKSLENPTLSEDSKKEIHEALERVLSSDLFSRSSVLSNFLKFIVEKTLEGHTDGLKEYTIAVNALGKPSDFNPQADAIVRIHAGRLRRLLNKYYIDFGKEDPVRIELIKGTYRPVFRSQWIEEPGLIVADDNIKYSRSKLTLAVLPFRNLLSDNEYQFFVDGFGEELTRIFSRFQEIAVVAHYSARKYTTNADDIRVIGSDLGVHYLVTGSVKRSPESIRVNVNLIKAMNGMQVWSQTYNYPLNIENLINIQDQIVENVCSVLGGYYGIIIHENSGTNQHNASNLNSFDAAFWNYYFHMNYSKENYLKTRHALENAIRHDPHYATGLAMLAELYLDAYSLGYPNVEDPVKEAFEHTKKAIRIDPHCQHAYQQYGWCNVYLQNKDEAVKALEYSLTLNPSSVSTMGGNGFGLACAGEYERAEVLLTQSLNLNPHCPWWFYLGFFLVFYQKQDYEKALEYANKIETVDVFLDPLTKAAAKGQLGKYDEAQGDVKLLNEKFSEIMAKIHATLDAFLLDKPLIDAIIEGAKKAGVSIA